MITLSQVSGQVVGFVLDPQGAAVPEARVTLLSGIEQRVVNADVTGFYRFDDLPPGPIEALAFDPRSALRGRAIGTCITDSTATSFPWSTPHGVPGVPTRSC